MKKFHHEIKMKGEKSIAFTVHEWSILIHQWKTKTHIPIQNL
jgi:hypothetical protein